MSLLDYFRPAKKSSASIAKERLQIIVAHSHDRSRKQSADAINLQTLKQKLIEVISTHLNIDEDKFRVQLEHDIDHSVLELNVSLPDEV